MKMRVYNESVQDIITVLKHRNVTLQQVSDELDYRDQASEGSKWDDDLYEYETSELEEIEEYWADK